MLKIKNVKLDNLDLHTKKNKTSIVSCRVNEKELLLIDEISNELNLTRTQLLKSVLHNLINEYKGEN